MSSIGRRAFARTLLLACGLAAAGACDNDVAPTAAPPEKAQLSLFEPTAYYVIRNVASGKVMDVSNNSTLNGAWIHQWEYEGLANQQWRITDLGNGYYKIVARHSGKALDVESASQSDGARIHQWSYSGLTNQQWRIYPCFCLNGGYSITARHSGKAAALTSGSLYANGLGVRQYAYAGGSVPTQLWTFEQVQ
jgi:hypothetical protein